MVRNLFSLVLVMSGMFMVGWSVHGLTHPPAPPEPQILPGYEACARDCRAEFLSACKEVGTFVHHETAAFAVWQSDPNMSLKLDGNGMRVMVQEDGTMVLSFPESR